MAALDQLFLLSGLLLCSCSPQPAPTASRAIDRVQAGTNMTWKTGNEDCLLHVTKRAANSLEGITIITRLGGEKTTITAATGTLSPGSVGDPADPNAVKLTVLNAQSRSTTKHATLTSLMLVLRDPPANRPHIRKTSLNAPALAMLGFGSLALLFTTRLFPVQVLRWPQTVRYRITAMLPALLGLLLLFLLLALEPRGYAVGFAAWICCAFGAAFSLANIRIPSLYSRILGALFFFIYGYLLFAFTLGLMIGGGI